MDAEGLDALLSVAGQDLLQELSTTGVTAGSELALHTRLRQRYPARLVSAALELTELRSRARSKFSRAEEMYFTREGLEQASSEVVSRHRARRYGGISSVADLCADIGGDLLALCEGRRVRAVDLDPLHLRIAALNARAYGCGQELTLHQEDVRATDLEGVRAVFVDPARRRDGKRELRPEESSPPLRWCLALPERVPATGIKAAPGIPLEIVPAGWEAEFVSVGGDLKESVLWSPALATATRRATLLPERHTLVPEDGPAVPCRMPGAYLLDPDPAVTRAGAVESLARVLDAWKIDGEIAFLSSDAPMRTPFGRALRVELSMPWGLKQLRSKLREMDVGTVDIRKRGSAVDVETLRKQLRLAGERRVTVVLTRALGRPWMLVCLPAQGT